MRNIFLENQDLDGKMGQEWMGQNTTGWDGMGNDLLYKRSKNLTLHWTGRIQPEVK